MKTRIIAGIIAATLLWVLVFKGSFVVMVAAAIGAGILACLEYDKLFFPRKNVRRQIRLVVLMALAVITLCQGPGQAWVFLWFPFTLLSIRHVFRTNQSADYQTAVRELALEVLGFVYVVSLVGFLVPIALWQDHGREYLLLLFLLVFGGDTAAYFVGTRWGKHRLAKRLSPKKSIEGAIAALFSALLITSLWLRFFYTGPSVTEHRVMLLLFAPVLSALAQVGDLFESLLKRSRAQKDSGHFLPGHGGILDRIDGLALATPVFYFFLIFVLEPRA